ncbi:ribosomal protein S30-domain-containing protein [Favolaschia claudopus]|uniref:Ribosomal protein S30-domain-containing protein n=1 Tax=Favolaschia claudopus TaxID=2862362 RepID=A0AAW0CTQ5_9AGAR
MGKVHGSLARAGKVKGQTPKVDKQEKKKTPKGRAKKRILYNRRFVNVTTLPGGKRRMLVLFLRHRFETFPSPSPTPPRLLRLMIPAKTSIVHTESTVLINMHLTSFAPI